MNKAYLLAFFVVLPFLFTSNAHAQKVDNKSLDQIVAVVNDHIILKSEVDQRVQEYLYQMQQQDSQDVQFSKDVWYTVLQDMVQNFVLLDQAKVDSVVVTDDKVDQALDRRINQIVQRAGSEEAVEKQTGKSLLQLRADWREKYREDMIVQQYKQQKMQTIDITRPEVEDYFNKIPQDSLPTIPEKVALSQIVAVAPPNNKARKEAREFAEQLRDSVVNHGKSIEEMAKKYSDGPSASNGGHIPMYPMDQLAPEYSAAAAALKPGEISKVVETSFGFHVIRLNKRQGDQIDTNHILITIDEENYNKQAAIDKLNQIKDSLHTPEGRTFAEFARQESEDPNTAPQGGRILNPNSGSRLIALNQLDPALYRIVLLLDGAGAISDPKPFTIKDGNSEKKAYRIVREDQHIQAHTANLKDDYDAIKSSALQQKQYRILQDWIDKKKDNVYIEYKIPMPDKYVAQNK